MQPRKNLAAGYTDKIRVFLCNLRLNDCQICLALDDLNVRIKFDVEIALANLLILFESG